ncbi:MAG: hypothetical protein AAGI30_00525 [Planctomycetota bacterium]
MIDRTRAYLSRLHRDESGPNTVEWILLIIVALVILIGIYFFAQYALDKFNENQKNLRDEGTFLKDGVTTTGAGTFK